LQTTTKHKCVARIINKITSINVPTPTYLGLFSQFSGAPFKVHKFWFYVDDMNHHVGGLKCMYVVDRLIVPNIWHVQEKPISHKMKSIVF
jgi:hypothetical protein